jgi:hypothetical protein
MQFREPVAAITLTPPQSTTKDILVRFLIFISRPFSAFIVSLADYLLSFLFRDRRMRSMALLTAL